MERLKSSRMENTEKFSYKEVKIVLDLGRIHAYIGNIAVFAIK